MKVNGRGKRDFDRAVKRDLSLYGGIALALLLYLWMNLTIQSKNVILDDRDTFEVDKGWTVEYSGKKAHVNLPVHVPAKAGEKVTFRKTLMNRNEFCNAIMFHSSHQYVHVYLDNQEILSYGDHQKTPFHMSVGNAWQYIRLENGWNGKELRIETESVYDNYAGVQEMVYLGTKSAMMFMLVHNAFKAMFWLQPIMIIGVELVLASFIFHDKRMVRRIRSLGLFGVVTSLWIFLESKVTQIFTGRNLLVLNLIFLLFGLVPILFSRYLLTYKGLEERRSVRFAYWYSLATYILIQVLQIMGIEDYIETVPLIHIAIIVVILGILDSYFYRKKKLKKEIQEEESIPILFCFCRTSLG